VYKGMSDIEIPQSRQTDNYNFETNESHIMYTTQITGKMQQLMIGVPYTIKAKLVYSEKYKSYSYETVTVFNDTPKTLDEQKSFLLSIVTNNQASSLLSVYPNIVEKIMNGEEIDLTNVVGIKELTFGKIKNKVIENYAIADILSILVPIGISFKKIKRLLDDEPNPLVLKEKLLKNPYILSDVPGISFATVDSIATQLNNGLLESEERLVAFLKHDLEYIGNSEGHCWVNIQELKDDVFKTIPECYKFFEIFIEKEKANPRFLHIDENKIGLKYHYDAEKYIYDFLERVHNSVPLEIKEENILNGIIKSETEQGFKFSDEQKNILYEMTRNSLSILSGFGGSGKSSLSRGILNIYKDAGYTISVSCLSAKAAKRIGETTGFKESMTIHRLLESDSTRFRRNESNKLNYSVYLLDESSMINSYIFMSLFKAIDSETSKIILVGDHFQLASIGVGQVFTDLLETKNKYQKNVLTQIFRQSDNSSIFIDAMKIRNGKNPVPIKEKRIVHGDNKDMIYVFSDDKEYLHNVALSAYEKAVKEDGDENVVILSPRKKDVFNSTQQFNSEIQVLINGENINNKYQFGKKTFLLNDRVIAIKNNKDLEVYNGFLGRVTNVNKDGFTAIFDDDIVVEYNKENVNEVELAGSLSIHRVQGSEFKSVIVVLDMSSFMLLSSNLAYTAFTRGQKRVLICAQPSAFDMCLKELDNQRNTYLKEMLKNES